MRAILAELRDGAENWFRREEVQEAARHLGFSLDMRYVGQNYELGVELAAGDIDRLTANGLREAFFAVHERSYGYHNPDDPVEIVNFRLAAVGRFQRPPTPPRARAETAVVATATRPVQYREDEAVEAPIYDRSELRPGHELDGPAVIEQLDATTLLHPGDRLVVDGAGNLVVEVGT